MNVYDFDGTIYRGDSSIDFYFYALKKHPTLVKFLPLQLGGIIFHLYGKIDRTQMKERFFCFLSAINGPELVEEFWQEHQQKIYSWYLAQHKEEDIVISASPEFLLRPICSKLGIARLIASRIDPCTGRFEGENCKGKEKAERLQREYAVTHIEKFYSDSETDWPLAEIAEEAFLVKNGVPGKWPGLQ